MCVDFDQPIKNTYICHGVSTAVLKVKVFDMVYYAIEPIAILHNSSHAQISETFKTFRMNITI